MARIYMQAGQGNITINGRDMKTYFGNELLENIVNQPLATIEQVGQYDIKVNVRGGGISAQAEAIRLAISKAIVGDNTELAPR